MNMRLLPAGVLCALAAAPVTIRGKASCSLG
jgi:hypothetical protein